MPAARRLLLLSLCLALVALPAAATEPAGVPGAKKPAAPHAADAKPTPVVSPKKTPPKHPPAHAKAPPAPVPAPAPTQPAPEAKPAAPAEQPKGSSGLPLPRFAALRADEVNMRSGPGIRYPIEWVYKRRDLPVEIEREFEVWRLVRDPEGVKGWVHQATLTGRRSFVVTGTDQVMRRSADDTAAAVATLKPGVIGRLRGCQAGAAWCQVQVGDYRGWLKRDQFWGTYAAEAVTP